MKIQKKDALKGKLEAINAKDYGACQSLRGEYDFSDYTLKIQKVPKDPYAPPHTGIYTIRVNRNDEHIINLKLDSKIQEVAFRDFLTRRFYHASADISKSGRGTGFSGAITINQASQAILDRNCVCVDEKNITVRCFVGVPASGRKVNSKIALKMFFEELPEIIEMSLFQKNISLEELQRHIKTAEDSEYLRNQLDSLGLVAFIADGSILPRKNATSEHALDKESALPFVSPETLKQEINLPHAGLISGMGIAKGVTLIVGGGYHGKSTLLNALELGCYNHVLGDGREQCVSVSESVKIRAYSGRSIVKTDISPFIQNLPFQKDTTEFSTENSSGSTSQAASIIEAIDVGAKVLLMDEDTCATNFMIRDSKMQQLVQKADEPISPFIDRVRHLYTEKGISTILVLGGVGDYFDVSDQVIQMNQYKAMDVTQEAHEISRNSPIKRTVEIEHKAFSAQKRIPLPESINPYSSYGKKRIFAKEIHRLNFGDSIIDLTDLEQLIELSQTKALGHALDYIRKYMNQKTSLKDILDQLMEDIEVHGLDILSEHRSGYFAEFRLFELAFAMNRLRGLDIRC